MTEVAAVTGISQDLKDILTKQNTDTTFAALTVAGIRTALSTP
jgi:hypothetical protein